VHVNVAVQFARRLADPGGFWQAISPLLRQAANAGRPVRVFGEMVSLLWAS
jgi:hypothetical protein